MPVVEVFPLMEAFSQLTDARAPANPPPAFGVIQETRPEPFGDPRYFGEARPDVGEIARYLSDLSRFWLPPDIAEALLELLRSLRLDCS